MESLLAKLSEQQTLIAKQKSALVPATDTTNQAGEGSSTSPSLLTPATDSFGRSSPDTDGDGTVRLDKAEMARLKKELDAAKDQIARQRQELEQSRVIKHTLDQAMESPSAAGSPRVNPFMGFNRPPNTSQGQILRDDSRSEGSDAVFPINSGSNIWANTSRPAFRAGMQPEPTWNQSGPRPWSQGGVGNVLPPLMMPQQQSISQRNFSVPLSPVGANRHGMNDFKQINKGRGFGHPNAPQNSRNASMFQPGNGWDTYTGAPNSIDGMSINAMSPNSAYPPIGMYPSSYQPQPIGTPLSPTAAEFRAGQASSNPWNAAVSRHQILLKWISASTNVFLASGISRTNLCVANGTIELPSPA